jgi:hypothetical protein
MYHIQFLSPTVNHWVSQIYAGFYELAAKGEARIKIWGKLNDKQIQSHHSFIFWAYITHQESGRSKLLCFDMADWSSLGPEAIENIEQCDIYFKRGYSASQYVDLPPQLKTKIKPLGLLMPTFSPAEKNRLTRIFRSLLTTTSGSKKRLSYHDLKDPLNISYSYSPIWRHFVHSHFLAASEWIKKETTNSPRKPQIIYQTRIFRDIRGKQIPINDERAELIRRLKREFGSSFIGGLIATEDARRLYPDCLTEHPSTRIAYRKLLHSSLIGISTKGTMDSNPVKLAEYLASGCCIVTEPLKHQLPKPLENSINLLEFSNADQCLEACTLLLENRDFAKQMSLNNIQYFKENVLPLPLIENLLAVAFPAE